MTREKGSRQGKQIQLRTGGETVNECMRYEVCVVQNKFTAASGRFSLAFYRIAQKLISRNQGKSLHFVWYLIHSSG